MEELEDPPINFLLLGIAGEVWGLCVLWQIFHFAEKIYGVQISRKLFIALVYESFWWFGQCLWFLVSFFPILGQGLIKLEAWRNWRTPQLIFYCRELLGKYGGCAFCDKYFILLNKIYGVQISRKLFIALVLESLENESFWWFGQCLWFLVSFLLYWGRGF